MAQVDVKFKEIETIVNSAFSPHQFLETVSVFHQDQGDILIFPEYYLPLEHLKEAIDLLVEENQSNKIYIIPLSQISLYEFEKLCQEYNVTLEDTFESTVEKKLMYVNVALIIVVDKNNNMNIFSQLKLLPAFWETKPHKEIVRAKLLYIFRLAHSLNFTIPICFSFIGKDYDKVSNLEPLIPFIKEGKVDLLFIPQLNQKPLHWTFIRSINNICDISNGATSIFLTNAANGVGRSSIVDLFTKKLLTSQYDIKDLDNQKYKHLIFISTSERLLKYKFVKPRHRMDKLSPDFVREIDIDVFEYKKDRGKWLSQTAKVVYQYSSAGGDWHIRFSPEVIEMRLKLPVVQDSLEYMCSISRSSHLGHIDNWEELIKQLLYITDVILAESVTLKPIEKLWILKLVGEYHEMQGHHGAAYFLFEFMTRLASRISQRNAVYVSNFLLMRILSRFADRKIQDYSVKMARNFLHIASNDPGALICVGQLLPEFLNDALLITACYSSSNGDMYKYGSFSGAKQSLEYNLMEPDKISLVRRSFNIVLHYLDRLGLSETSHQYLHYLDICCLANLVMGKFSEAERYIQGIREYDLKQLGIYGQYFASIHNEALMMHIVEERSVAESMYLRLLQEQREYQGKSSLITAKNLGVLLKDRDVAKYLVDTVDYGNPRITHKDSSRIKAKTVYGLGKQALKRMC